MTIKQQGGIFGRNPTFNDVTVDGTLTTSGDVAFNTDTLYVDTANDRVGVRTATPDSAFEVVGEATFGSGTYGVKLTYSGGNQSGIIDTADSANNLEFRVQNSKKLVINSSGNLVVNSGNGIDFSATSGTGTSELFDDYEEGTWTPIYAPASGAFGSITYDTAVTGGRYTKVGNLVHIQGGIRTDAITVGTASGGIRLGGLPFAAIASGTGHDGWSTLTIGQATAFAGDVPSAGSVVAGQSYFELQYRSAANGATIDLAVADLDTGADDNLMRFSATYIAG